MKIGMFDVKKANTIIFDCDGVILNSNQLKTKAYYKATFPSYGHELASSLTTYLAINTGKPRDHFFDYFLRNIVPSDISGPGLKELVSEVTVLTTTDGSGNRLRCLMTFIPRTEKIESFTGE